jgi:YD repeat-containing protein
MNGRSIFSIAIVVLMLTSGPLALPLSIYLLQSPSKQVNASPDKTILPKMGTTLIVKASASPTSGSSPLFVSLTANINTDNMTQFIQLYKWDFDGDGLDDYVSLDRAPTTHVYETSVSSVFNTTLTIVMKDGSTSKGSVLINVEPTDPTQWLEIKDMGPAKFGINTNGTIFIYDQTSWIPLTFAKNAEPLKGPTVAKPKEDKSRVTYRTGSTLLDVNIVFGAEGMATFNMTEYLPRGSNDLSQLGGLTLPTGVAKGGLVFSYLDSPPKIDKKQSVVNVLYFPKVQTGSGNVWGTGGAAYSPWRDQGVTPYGEYFKGLQEYVATETGYLTVTQTDLNIPGRGLDLVIKRVSAPPSTFDGWQPAFANDYTYQNNPWAPMGNGWSLSFPWIETFAGTPTYIHLGNGQRYKYNSSNGGTNVYHSGDHFKLYKYANSSYALYTADGVKYVFDSSCKPTKIIDVDGNQITLTYTSNKITSITDTIGRSVTVSYNTDGLVSSISTGGLSVSYTYVNGIVTGKRLATVTDPQGRVTKYRYLTDYLISQIEYPTGGYSTYNYGAYYSSGYSRYRVTSQTIHDASTSVSSCKTYTYTATYGSVTDVTISEYSSETLTKKTVLDYSQSNRVSKSIYDGESNRYGLTNEFIDSTHRRKTIDKYPGYLSTYNETISRYDSWGNVVYEKEYLGHERYYSYLNTDTSGKYVDSNGAQVGYFTDSFYGPTPNAEIHNLLAGEAEFQNGVGSLPIESYYKYDSRGHMTEVKQLKDGGWLVTSASYDSYGNPNKVTDPNGYLTYYIYNSTYSGAYLTSIKRRLVGSPSQNVTASYGYNSTTGLLIRGVDEKGNATAYRYDKVGRTTNVTYPRVNGVTAKRSAVYYDDAVYSSTYSPSTVVAATSSQYVSWTNRYIVKAAGLWWAFYYIGSSQYVYYKTSPDGSTWSSQTPIIYTPWTDNWGICYDGTYFQLTYSACGWMYRLYYIRGQPWSNGTIKWGAYQTVVQNDGNWYIDCKIVTDSYGYTWIAFKTQSTPFSYIDVYKNTKKDGTWSSDPAPSTYYSSTIDSSESHLKWASLTNGKLALLLSACEYLGSPDLTCVVWNGGSWGSKETIATWTSSVQPYDAVAVGDNVYAAFQTDSNGVQMRRRDYSSATWGTASNVVSNRPVQLTKTDWNDIYAIYVSGTNINYKVYDGSAWSTESTLVSGDSPMSVNTISSTYQAKDSRLGVVYQKSSSGYSVRFEILSLRETRNPKMTTFDENCNKVINYYDGVGRLVKTERYNGTTLFSTESHTFNYLGLTASKTTATGQVYRYDYSGMGDLVKTTNPDGSYSSTTINYSYNTWDARDEVGRRKILAYDCMAV